MTVNRNSLGREGHCNWHIGYAYTPTQYFFGPVFEATKCHLAFNYSTQQKLQLQNIYRLQSF